MPEQFFEPVIGLEIHLELKTNSKMFCGCQADWFNKPPNSLCCPVCLGLPGALPVPNKKAVEWCVLLGLALNCRIPLFSKFDRKNYFYPDLPKGYQISQYDQPLACGGFLKFKMPNQEGKIEEKTVRIRRVHLEEDTGKLLHTTIKGEKWTLIDFNRSGVPLVEIVTEPDLRGSEEARIFLKKLYQIIRYLGISEADMEKGSMRLEPNISVRKVKRLQGGLGLTRRGSSKGKEGRKDSLKKELELPPYKVEVKNINSFAFAKKAIDYEIQRQIELLKQGKIPRQETRGWDEKKGITYSQRSKEEAHDYRYFPEPDIPPIRWKKGEVEKLRKLLPELPERKRERFMKDYHLSEYDAGILANDLETANYFEKTVTVSVKDTLRVNKRQKTPGRRPKETPLEGEARITPKTIANWIINRRVDITAVSPEELLKLIRQKTQGQTLSEQKLEEAVKKVIRENPKTVADYKSGKHQAVMFLVGQAMRETKGKGNAEEIRQKLLNILG